MNSSSGVSSSRAASSQVFLESEPFLWIVDEHSSTAPHANTQAKPGDVCCGDLVVGGRYRSPDEGGYDTYSNRNTGYGDGGDYNRGGEGRGGRDMGRGRAGGRSGRGRRGYFTDGRGGRDFEGEGERDSFSRGGRSPREGGARGRGRGQGRGRQAYGEAGRSRSSSDYFEGGRVGRGGRADTGSSGVWGYEDEDDDDMVGVRPTRAPASAVRVESSQQGVDMEVDAGSLGSRMGPVDREHFYSVKVCPLPRIILLALVSPPRDDRWVLRCHLCSPIQRRLKTVFYPRFVTVARSRA